MTSVSEAAPESQASSVRLAATLGFAGLFAGLALVMVYEATLPIINANKAEALRKAVFKVVPASQQADDPVMKALTVVDGKLALAAEGAKTQLVYSVFDGSGALLGYAIPGEGPGFQDVIKLIYGYSPDDGAVIGMEILESRETPGLGDKIYKDPEFAKNFEALAVEPAVTAVKHGNKTAANEVDSITGATISSVAVAKIIQKTNEMWLSLLPNAADARRFATEASTDTGSGESK